jgi:hypothetical protein
MTLFKPDQFIFLQFAVRYSPLFSLDLPELQIDDILRYLRQDDKQESAPQTLDVPTTSPQPSSPSTFPTALNKWMASGSTKLYYNHHTYTKRVTRDGRQTWEVRMCFDDELPMMFNHKIAGAAKPRLLNSVNSPKKCG